MNADAQNLEQKARKALELVERFGIDFIRGSHAFNSDLERGLKLGFYGSPDIDSANVQYLDARAREALELVERWGIDYVIERYNSRLEYGLEHGLFDQSAIDGANTKYLTTELC